jgi:2-dehydropantoate 2-reductase
VISALKAHQVYASAAEFLPLLRDDTAIVTAVNGIPWWYPINSGGP